MCDVGNKLRPVMSGTPKVNPYSPLLYHTPNENSTVIVISAYNTIHTNTNTNKIFLFSSKSNHYLFLQHKLRKHQR